MKIGTTAFNNKTSDVRGTGIAKEIYEQYKQGLVNRGYTVLPSKSESDLTIEVEAGRFPNEPSGYGPEGPGFFIHIVLGINTGVQAQTVIYTRLKDPKTGDIRYVSSVTRIKRTDVKTNANRWEDFSKADRSKLLATLKKQIDGIAEEALDKAGL